MFYERAVVFRSFLGLGFSFVVRVTGGKRELAPHRVSLEAVRRAVSAPIELKLLIALSTFLDVSMLALVTKFAVSVLLELPADLLWLLPVDLDVNNTLTESRSVKLLLALVCFLGVVKGHVAVSISLSNADPAITELLEQINHLPVIDTINFFSV